MSSAHRKLTVVAIYQSCVRVCMCVRWEIFGLGLSSDSVRAVFVFLSIIIIYFLLLLLLLLYFLYTYDMMLITARALRLAVGSTLKWKSSPTVCQVSTRRRLPVATRKLLAKRNNSNSTRRHTHM